MIKPYDTHDSTTIHQKSVTRSLFKEN